MARADELDAVLGGEPAYVAFGGVEWLYRTYGGHSLSIYAKGVSKWSGVESFCRSRGLDSSRVLAVGDGDNDAELLARAAIL